jgi:ribose 5-phosphate isomerase A
LALDVNVDGPNEVAPELALVALVDGGHRAHLREKIVASAARESIVMADETKMIENLGKLLLLVETMRLALPLSRCQLKPPLDP